MNIPIEIGTTSLINESFDSIRITRVNQATVFSCQFNSSDSYRIKTYIIGSRKKI